LSLEVQPGEIFGIIGRSGAGKSTLLRCINLLERPDEGSVTVGGVELTRLTPRELQLQRRRIGMVFQHFNLLTTATARENIAFPLRLAKLPRAEIRRRVDELLDMVGMAPHADKYPAQLSGGQKQRVGIARALANRPDVLLCDEATSALDPETTRSILALLQDINRQLGVTIVVVTHEMHVIRAVCDRVAVMHQGRIVESGRVLDLFLHPQHPVTKDLLRQTEEFADDIDGTDAPGETTIRLYASGPAALEPVLTEAVRGTAVQAAILQGNVGKMKEVPYARLTVKLSGSHAEIDAVIAEIRGRSWEVEEVR
jgi:D-methionine transport system ATP-binding protein